MAAAPLALRRRRPRDFFKRLVFRLNRLPSFFAGQPARGPAFFSPDLARERRAFRPMAIVRDVAREMLAFTAEARNRNVVS
jgi:hypothetical protein